MHNSSEHPSELTSEAIEEIIGVGALIRETLDRLETCEETPLDLPSVLARLEASFIPSLPWRLFHTLVPLPGKALAIYLVLWRTARMYKTATVRLTSTSVQGLGLSRDQKRRALEALETAGLVIVERTNGKNPRVTLRAEDRAWVKKNRANGASG
jgi:hypothetical protein